MKKLLVTGGAGFIGSNFVKHILEQNKDVSIINLDSLTYAGNLMNFEGMAEEAKARHEFIRGDIKDEECVNSIFSENDLDGVVHFAAESHVDRSISGPEEFVQTNVLGTFRLLEAARKYWDEKGRPAVFRFLHVSTDEVYGSLGDEGYFTETTPYDPSSPYSASKAASDLFVRAYCRTYGLPVLVTNCSNNYGPYQFPEKLIPLVIANIVDKKTLPVYGDGKNVRDWLYVTDHCDAIWQVLHEGRVGETYNIGGMAEKQNIEIVRLLCDLVDEKLGRPEGESRNLIEFVKDRPGHDQRYAIDCAKIMDELGWKPRHDFEAGIRETVNWYLGNADWVAKARSGEYRDWIDLNYGDRSGG